MSTSNTWARPCAPWIRELRNAINHEYEDETARLAEFFALLAKETTALFGYFSRLQGFCAGVYGTGGD